MLLEVVRDDPGALGVMAQSLRMSTQAVSQDLSALHSLEYEVELEGVAARYDPALLDAAGLRPGDRVLDIGCGSGGSTRAAARALTTGSVLGLDLSAAAVTRARARSRAERRANLAFEQADAAAHSFAPASFDVALSRFGAMYFEHPVPAFANIAQALRPRGRLALVAWREAARNEWMTAVGEALAMGRPLPERRAGGPGAFGLAREDDVRRILGQAGFVDVTVQGRSEPVSLGRDANGAYAMVSTQGLARDLLSGLDATERKAALARLRTVLTDHDTPQGVVFGSSCWIVTACRP